MSWKIPLSTNAIINLDAGVNLLVAKDVDVYVEDNYGISGNGSTEVIIEGSVISDDYNAISLSASNDPANVISLTVARGAQIRSLDDTAVSLGGPDVTFKNAGSITAAAWAIGIGGDGGTMDISNSGRIVSGDFGFYVFSTSKVVLHNSGTIVSDTFAYQAGDGGTNINLITNTGRMVGRIGLGFGNDLYDGRKGHVTGTVTDIGGNDRIYGGTENNTFDGGVGKDTLWGGGGADILTGGTGADHFLFRVLGDSTVAARGRDTITDFVHEVDTIDLGAIDANTRVKGDQGFRFIGTQDFHHKAGELHVVRTSGDTIVQGDVNGDGKADFAITLTGHISLNGGDFAL